MATSSASAWAAASYVRVFGGDKKILAVPLYASAIITGYSRIKAKRHTVTQVVAAAVMSECVTMLNAKMSWSSNYHTTHINITPDGASFNLQINF